CILLLLPVCSITILAFLYHERQCLKSRPMSQVVKLDLGAVGFYVEIIGLREKSGVSRGSRPSCPPSYPDHCKHNVLRNIII
uniref:Uncharacterized protein n=1 Tax=Mola mola TaxID=94237 RepID=A0A3Q3XH87_MOLML